MAETLVKVVNSSGSKVSLSSGYLIDKFSTVYIPISKLQFDEALLNDLASQITASHLSAYIGGVTQTADDIETLVAGWTAEAPHEHTDWQESITERHDPTGALPVAPSDGNRFWSLATANGWTINRIYVWNASTSTYTDIVPSAGLVVYIEADSMLYIWNGTALATIAEGTRIRARFTAIDVKAVANYTAALNGISTDGFIPETIVVRLTAVGAPLNGNTHITVGTAAAGTQILPDTTLTGFANVNTSFSIPVAGLIDVSIAANATLHLRVTSADTGGGTGTAECWIEGYTI